MFVKFRLSILTEMIKLIRKASQCTTMEFKSNSTQFQQKLSIITLYFYVKIMLFFFSAGYSRPLFTEFHH